MFLLSLLTRVAVNSHGREIIKMFVRLLFSFTFHSLVIISSLVFVLIIFLAVQNIQIASYSGVVGAIITNVLDCSVSRILIKLYSIFDP